jgi:hypothetical protein
MERAPVIGIVRGKGFVAVSDIGEKALDAGNIFW